MWNLRSCLHFPLILFTLFFVMTGFALAQPSERNRDSSETGETERNGRTQMDSEQIQQRMVKRYQDLLGMSDEEWAVIGPYVLKVTTLSSSTQSWESGMRTMMMSGRGNTTRGTQTESGGAMTQPDDYLEALETLLEDENATSDEIKAKLSALRTARETARQELAMAQKELRELLTLRQEATLVVMGLLE